jgi:hypothetical protein
MTDGIIMGKIITDNQNNTIVLFNKLAKAENINGREIDNITKDTAGVFLPVDFTMQKKDRYLRCVAANCIPLSNFLHIPIGKKQFFELVMQTVKMLRMCERKAMHIKNLELNCERVFVNVKTQNLQFVYWSIVNAETSVDLVGFLMDFAYRAVFNREENTNYVMEYVQFLKMGSPFSLNHFERYVADQLGIKETFRNPYLSEPISGETNERAVSEDKAKQIAYTPNYEITNNDVGNTAPDNGEEPQTSHTLNVSHVRIAEDEKTSYLGIGSFNQRQALLVRERTRERIPITNQLFKIGSSKSMVDYVILDNKTISRHHASIITENGHYYIMDNGSTNKTYVNGNLMPVDQKFEITEGAKIRFSNEDFAFCLE